MYKQIKPLEKSGKMAVTPEQSAEVQKVLFEMGYSWTFFGCNINHIDGKYLFWRKGKNVILYNNYDNSEFFDNQPEPLHTFTDYFEPLK